jgi:amino acid adenylation domain-containing protein
VSVPELFARQVRRTPDAPAVVSVGDEKTLSYAELDERAGQLAHVLAARGAGPEVLVGLHLRRGVDLVVAMLAVLRTGAAYVPLDPAYPPARLEWTFADAGATMLVTEPECRSTWHATAAHVLDVSEASEASEVAAPQADYPEVLVRPANPAYLIYTSGSTGRPKGVLVTHAGVVNLVAALRERLGAGQGSRVLQFAPAGFDAAFWELAMAVLTGATLVLAPAARIRPGRELAELVASQGVTHLTLPPSALALLPTLPAEVTITVAGEAVPGDLVARWSAGHRVFNGYGPTEVTVCATLHGPMPADEPPAIGRPLDGIRAYVLDPNLQPVPAGVTAELYLAGPALARGYHGRPALTATRFVACPSGGRMFRTGDLVRWLPDGTLEYVGRRDDQVKVRGFRIEPAEIESALSGHPGLAHAVVQAVGEGPRRHLVGYVVPRDEDAPTASDLRAFLAATLPDHLIPSAFVVMERLPVTPNGKLDRLALPLPGTPVTVERPKTGTERAVAEIWAELLDREEIGVREKFFEAGGSSLTLMALSSRLSALDAGEVSVGALLEHSTVEQMARLLDGRRGATVGGERGYEL